MTTIEQDISICDCVCAPDPLQTETALVCRACGVVLDDIVFEKKSRIKTNRDNKIIDTHHPVSSPVEVGCRTSFYAWKAEKHKARYYRMYKENNRVKPRESVKYRIVTQFIPKIKALRKKYGFSDVIEEEVISRFVKIGEMGRFKGRNATIFIYALFHIFARIHQYSHSLIVEGKLLISPFFSLKRVAKLEGLSVNLLNRTVYSVRDIFNLFVPKVQLETRLEDVVCGLENKALVGNDFRQQIIPHIPLMKKIYEIDNKLKCHDPKWVVSGFFYIHRFTLMIKELIQVDLAEIFNVTEVTIRSYIKKVRKIEEMLNVVLY